MNVKSTLTGMLALSTLLFVGTGSAMEPEGHNPGNNANNNRDNRTHAERNFTGAAIGVASGATCAILGHSLMKGEFGVGGIVAAALGLFGLTYMRTQRESVTRNLGQEAHAIAGFTAILAGALTWIGLNGSSSARSR